MGMVSSPDASLSPPLRGRRIGLVLGGGGVIGNAYLSGVLEGLRRATGWDGRDAEVIVGTSAGSVNGALLSAGVGAGLQYAHVCGEPLPTEPPGGPAEKLARRRDREWTASLYPSTGQAPRPLLASPGSVMRAVQRRGRVPLAVLLTGLLGEGSRSTRTIGEIVETVWERGWPRKRFWAVATDLATGRRVQFGRTGAPATDLARAVRASCAIPGFFAPVRVQGRRYADGGLWSVSNLDLVARLGLDLVVCINPLSPTGRRPRAHSGAMEGWIDRLESSAWRGFGDRLARERARVEACGTPVLVLQPTPADLEVIPRNWMDPRPRAGVARRAVETTLGQLRSGSREEAVRVLERAAS